MARCLLALVFAGLASAPLLADPPNAAQASDDKKGTYLGVLFSCVPEAVYAQVPDLPRDQGVLVSYILPDSPAAKAGIHRHDILLEYDGETIADCDHFARKLCDDKPERTVEFALLRGGRKMSLKATLTLGPALKIVATGTSASREADPARGVVKTNGPASVKLAAQPMERDQLKVTIEYTDEKTGQRQTVTYTGKPDEIDSQIQKLPINVQPLVRAGLKGIYEQQGKGRDDKAPTPSEKR